MKPLLRTARCDAVALLLVLFLSGIHVSAAEKKGDGKDKRDQGDSFLNAGTIPHLKIEITGTNLAALKVNDREYVRATIRDDQQTYSDVGVHLKGAAGSFRPLNDRPALTLNFDKFKDGQNFHGMDKLHLNNSVQDPSYLSELLCSQLFRDAGVPAPRVGHARVELNGRDLGLYVLKEGFDRAFLKNYFSKSKGNLYDGGFLREITEPLEKTAGEGPSDHSDLKALVAAANEADPARRWEQCGRVLDVDRFISFLALEVLTWHWDGYGLKHNNYRLYNDPGSGKMVFLPQGMDQMFWDPNASLFPPFEGLVARALLQTPQGRERYRQRVSEIFTNSFQNDVIAEKLNQAHARIRPVLAKIDPNLAQQHDGAVANLKQQIASRIAGVTKQLAMPNPLLLKFDANGTATLGKLDWHSQSPSGNAQLERAEGPQGESTLRIVAQKGGPSISSWRTRLELAGGHYRFEGRVRTAGVLPARDQNFLGAGLRISGARHPLPNQVSGDTPWKTVAYEFDVPAGGFEITLVCELRAVQGEALFDLASLRLLKK